MRDKFQHSLTILSRWRLCSVALLLGLLTGCGTPMYHAGDSGIERDKLVQIARSMIGVPYRYGGESPEQGFDCSGLVQYTYKRAGYRMPRTTGQQYRHVQPIPTRFLRPGDLVFFSNKYDRFVSHVGIYVGNNRFIHAPSSGKEVSVANLRDPYWRRHFASAGRL